MFSLAFSYLLAEKISCSAELSMKIFYNLGARMGSVIPNEIKYYLHYGEVQGDILQPLQGT